MFTVSEPLHMKCSFFISSWTNLEKKILFHVVWQWNILYSTSFCSSCSLKLWWWQWVKYSNPFPFTQPDIVASAGHVSTLDFTRIVLVGLKKFCIPSSTTRSMVLPDINMSVLRGLAVLCLVSIHSWRFVCTFFICLFSLIVRTGYSISYYNSLLVLILHSCLMSSCTKQLEQFLFF